MAAASALRTVTGGAGPPGGLGRGFVGARGAVGRCGCARVAGTDRARLRLRDPAGPTQGRSRFERGSRVLVARLGAARYRVWLCPVSSGLPLALCGFRASACADPERRFRRRHRCLGVDHLPAERRRSQRNSSATKLTRGVPLPRRSAPRCFSHRHRSGTRCGGHRAGRGLRGSARSSGHGRNTAAAALQCSGVGTRWWHSRLKDAGQLSLFEYCRN